MNWAAHKLTSGSGYVGANNMHQACSKIQKAFGNADYQEMLLCYQSLVEATLQFKIDAKTYLAKLKGKCFVFINRDC